MGNKREAMKELSDCMRLKPPLDQQFMAFRYKKLIADSLVEGGQLLTNFLIIGDRNNMEHIFMDKIEFIKYAAEKGLWQSSNIIWQKRAELNMTCEKENSDVRN